MKQKKFKSLLILICIVMYGNVHADTYLSRPNKNGNLPKRLISAVDDMPISENAVNRAYQNLTNRILQSYLEEQNSRIIQCQENVEKDTNNYTNNSNITDFQQNMETINKTKHERLTLNSTYEEFTQHIDKVLNHLEPNWGEGLAKNPQSVKAHLMEIAGSSGLMIFGEQQHGRLLALKGHVRKAIQYTIGNPLTALEMTQYDIRASLYAPVKIIVYEAEDGQLYAEYDLPSSQFGQFGNKIFTIAKDLDKKLENAIREADSYGK